MVVSAVPDKDLNTETEVKQCVEDCIANFAEVHARLVGVDSVPVKAHNVVVQDGPAGVVPARQYKLVFDLLLQGHIFRFFCDFLLNLNCFVHVLKRRFEVSTVAGGSQTAPIMVADADRPLVVKLLEDFNRLKYVFPAHCVLAVEVLTHSQNFGHLAKTDVKLIHFFVRFLKAFK